MCAYVCVCVCERDLEAHIVYVHVSARLPRVTAMCQGLCSLVQMAQPLAPRVPRLPALIDQGRGSHGLGARGLIALSWPLGPWGLLGAPGSPSRDSKTIGVSSPSSHPPSPSLLNIHIHSLNMAFSLAILDYSWLCHQASTFF